MEKNKIRWVVREWKGIILFRVRLKILVFFVKKILKSLKEYYRGRFGCGI